MESRQLPATFGIPWPDPQHLTLSFMPDGTRVDGVPSQLSRTLDAAMPASAWELEVLHAFQTWADLADVNIAVVPDNGQAPGAAGPLQGHPGFGDIRIGAVPLSGGTLALSSPFDLTNDWSGVVLLDSQAHYGDGSAGTEDLFNAVLHEAGHVFGLPDNPADTLGAMYPLNNVSHTAPDAAEAALVAAQYGVRPANPLGNTTTATALPIGFVSGGSGAGVVDATLEGTSDADVYRVTDTAARGAFAVDLKASGISLLTARVTVEDASGRSIASSAAADPLHNNILLNVPGARKGARYYIEVQGANPDVFAIGSYRLAVGPAELDRRALAAPAPSAFATAAGNTSFASALGLAPQAPGTDARWPFLAQGRLAGTATTQYFAVRDGSPGASALLVTAWADKSNGLTPAITVLDAAGHPVASQVVARDGSSETIQVPSPIAGARYVVAVSAASKAVGGYHLAATFAPNAIAASPVLASGTLGASADPATSTLVVPGDEVFHLDLKLGRGATTSTAVALAVSDASGKVVGRLTARGLGGEATGDLLLPKGNYTLRIQGATGKKARAPMPTVDYTLRGTNRSQPIGVTAIDPTLTPIDLSGGSTSTCLTTSTAIVVSPFSATFDLLMGVSSTLYSPYGGVCWF